MTESDENEKPSLPFPALILCGGRSRRMGQDKAFLPLGSHTVLQRVENAFRKLTDRMVLVIGHDAKKPKRSGFSTIVRDQNPDFGPLEGLRVGFDRLFGSGVESSSEADSGDQSRDYSRAGVVLVGTCDAPLVVPAVYELLTERLLDSGAEIAIPFVDGQHYPLTAVYRSSVLTEISLMVENNDLRVKDLLGRVKVCECSELELRDVDPDLKTIRNINTKDEYKRMLGELNL